MKDDAQGNPKAVNDAVLGSESEDFFQALENDVNGLVQETQPKKETVAQETPYKQGPSKADVSNQGAQPSELDTIKQRYSASSREAQNLRAQLNELKPFVPVLDAMKKDNGLVSHVRDYFQNGGKVNQDIKSQLKLDEDFEFDPDDMVKNQDGDSRKVFNAMVDKIVQQRIGETVEGIQQQNAESDYTNQMNAKAQDFMQRNGLTSDEFMNFVNEAQHKFSTEGMSFDDMWLVVNKNRAAQNVANSTKKEMLNQMKGVRNIPTSQSASNNAGKPSSPNDNVFDALLNSDGNIEDLLG
tara:strand:- start:963 stop:1853 length:891 start_codon:yes stop_codon:yes gene_type:complete